MIRTIVVLCGIMAYAAVPAQWSDSLAVATPSNLEHHDEITLLTAYHQGRYGFLELGVGRSFYDMVHLPVGASYYAGVECRVDRPELVGLKAGLYASALIGFGLHYAHYMEGPDAMEVLRPELGFGVLKARLTYAYNIRLSRESIDGLFTHMLTMSYAFRMARLKGDDEHRSKRAP